MNLRPILKTIAPSIKAVRRHIHAHPERAWLEYGTAALVAKTCIACETDVTLGAQAVRAASRFVAPTEEICAREKARALLQGTPTEVQRIWMPRGELSAEAQCYDVEAFGNGLTGLWADMHFPAQDTAISGKGKDTENDHILALRFDMDANELTESTCASHVPSSQGFASKNPGLMHACGHDGHVAMGVGLLLALQTVRTQMPDLCKHLSGTVRFVFQPAEEVGQGAKAMLDAGAMVGVRDLIGIHLGIQARKRGVLICGTTQFLANSSFEIDFHGRAAHAGLAPHTGRNALMAAVAAVQSIQAISRHGDGASRVNIGEMRVDGAANVIPAHAWLHGETRGITTHVNDFMLEEVMRMSAAAAQMWGCAASFTHTSTCPSGGSDIALAQEIFDIAHTMPERFDDVRLTEKFWASEDFTWFLQDVQKRGGQSTFIQLGIDWVSGHHTSTFDYNDHVLLDGVELLLHFVLQKLKKKR